LVPFITTVAYQATVSLGYALIYPIAVLDARDLAEPHLGGTGGGKGVIVNLATQIECGADRAAGFTEDCRCIGAP
jgi:hypothetical protein